MKNDITPINNREAQENKYSHNQEEMRYFHILTYGCQMNEHDSEILAGILLNLGYHHTEQLQNADVIIFNTCCVRESAEDKIYGKIGSLKSLKESKPGLLIGICGCLVQKPGEVNRIRKIAPFVDFILGADSMDMLAEVLQRAVAEDATVSYISDDEFHSSRENLPRARTARHQAWVVIMHGCNNFCSYCIVPYVRGRERSRKPDEILTEIKELVQEGVREVTLLGQNVNSYGQGLSEEVDFADLLARVDSESKVERIRFMTSHPKDLSGKLIDTIARSEHICNHIHLPVQAGSNRILEKMNRKYTREDYFNRIFEIRQKIPSCSITTDIIVGFPGETEADFQETLDLTAQIRWNAAYTFLYSNRSGTSAANMREQIDESVKKDRLHRLMDLQNKISYEINQSQIGNTFEVMIEGPSKTNPEVWASRTTTNQLVLFPKSKNNIHLMPGSFAYVQILEAKTWTLHGQEI